MRPTKQKLVQVSTYSRSAGCSSESQLNVPFSTETTESNKIKNKT